MRNLSRPPVPKPLSDHERLATLNLSEHINDEARLTVSALLEQTDDLARQLERARARVRELEAQADFDPVAGIPNRRVFMRRLEWAIAMHERYKHPAAIVYFDLNNFKAINDHYGHAAGDMAILHAAHILNDFKRETDFVARIGGDEFALLMHYADAHDAARRGRMIAARLQDAGFAFNGQPLALSAACGVHALAQGDTAETALHAADMAMYEDKKRFKSTQVTRINA